MAASHPYLILIRGINVGGKNKVPMAELRDCLEVLGFTDVTTYINSGNVILRSDKSAVAVKDAIEAALPRSFKLDSDILKVLVLTPAQLQAVIAHKPKGFGDTPEKYYSDAIFLIDVAVDEVMPIFNPREGVDRIWPGQGMVYSERLGAERTKSRLSTIMLSPLYKSMTIRSWNTVTKLMAILNDY